MYSSLLKYWLSALWFAKYLSEQQNSEAPDQTVPQEQSDLDLHFMSR